MEVVCLRHAESEYNLLGLCNDDDARQVALTGRGREQAQAAGRRLADWSFDAIFHSPLLRARETAKIVNRRLAVAVVLSDARLADIRSGCDGHPVQEYQAAIAHDPLCARANNGESLLEHKVRVLGFIRWLADQPYQRVLCVAHEETLRVFRVLAEGLPDSSLWGMSFANCGEYRFELRAGWPAVNGETLAMQKNRPGEKRG